MRGIRPRAVEWPRGDRLRENEGPCMLERETCGSREALGAGVVHLGQLRGLECKEGRRGPAEGPRVQDMRTRGARKAYQGQQRVARVMFLSLIQQLNQVVDRFLS